MPVSSKFLTESTGVKIVKIGQYLAKIWAKHDSLVFFGPPCMSSRLCVTQHHAVTLDSLRRFVNCRTVAAKEVFCFTLVLVVFVGLAVRGTRQAVVNDQVVTFGCNSHSLQVTWVARWCSG